MVVFPNAKINLGLNILEKRKDGYHNISSCFFPVPWNDILEIIESKKLDFTSSGIEIPGNWQQNLCIKAYNLLKKDFNLPPVAIHLHKIIPIGAGLGGGSSDASFTLKLLNEMFNLFLEPSILEIYAAQIGSDCPFFIENKPVIASEKGTVFSSVDVNLKGKYMVIVHPSIHISTVEAYSEITPSFSEIIIKDVVEKEDVKSWTESLRNDFEEGVFKKYPEIKNIKEMLYSSGALYASMSGSGSAVFGIFDQQPTPITFPKNYTIWEGLLKY